MYATKGVPAGPMIFKSITLRRNANGFGGGKFSGVNQSLAVLFGILNMEGSVRGGTSCVLSRERVAINSEEDSATMTAWDSSSGICEKSYVAVGGQGILDT